LVYYTNVSPASLLPLSVQPHSLSLQILLPNSGQSRSELCLTSSLQSGAFVNAEFLNDGNRTFNSADGTPLDPPSRLYIVRGFLRHNNVHRCNSGGWLMSLNRWVLCYVTMLYIFSLEAPCFIHCHTYNVVSNYLNTQKCFRNLLCCFVFVLPWKTVTDIMAFRVYFPLQCNMQYNLTKSQLYAVTCKTHRDFRNCIMFWKVRLRFEENRYWNQGNLLNITGFSILVELLWKCNEG